MAFYHHLIMDKILAPSFKYFLAKFSFFLTSGLIFLASELLYFRLLKNKLSGFSKIFYYKTAIANLNISLPYLSVKIHSKKLSLFTLKYCSKKHLVLALNLSSSSYLDKAYVSRD